MKRLQIPAGAIRWLERWEPLERPHQIVLHLGCNILPTPDLAADVVAVFEALGLDFVAVAGVQFCCGPDPLAPRGSEPGRATRARRAERSPPWSATGP